MSHFNDPHYANAFNDIFEQSFIQKEPPSKQSKLVISQRNIKIKKDRVRNKTNCNPSALSDRYRTLKPEFRVDAMKTFTYRSKVKDRAEVKEMAKKENIQISEFIRRACLMYNEHLEKERAKAEEFLNFEIFGIKD